MSLDNWDKKVANTLTEMSKPVTDPWKELLAYLARPTILKPAVISMREEDFEDLKHFNLSDTHESAHGKETL